MGQFNKQYSKFNLKGEDEFSDEFAISIAIDSAKRLLREPTVTARQIIGLGHALYALERIPSVTPGVHVEFGVSLDVEVDFSELRYFNFLITDWSFEIMRGGSIDLGAGSDSYSSPGWHIEVNGFREAECELYLLEDELIDLLGCGAKINVYDESDIDYDEVS